MGIQQVELLDRGKQRTRHGRDGDCKAGQDRAIDDLAAAEVHFGKCVARQRGDQRDDDGYGNADKHAVGNHAGIVDLVVLQDIGIVAEAVDRKGLCNGNAKRQDPEERTHQQDRVCQDLGRSCFFHSHTVNPPLTA